MDSSWRPRSQAFPHGSTTGVVHFWAAWNGYDRAMDQLLSELEREFTSEMPLFSCNFDDPANWALAEAATVVNLPALVLVVEGKPMVTVIGLRPESAVRSTLREWRAALATP